MLAGSASSKERVGDARLLVLLIVACSYGLFVALLLKGRDWDSSYLVVAGSAFVNRAAAPANLQVWQGSTGYDGQFFYRLALNPFTSQSEEFGLVLDHPAYRQQRIVYPLLAWAFAFGDPQRVPAALLGVNYAAVCAVGWLSAALAQIAGRPAWWGLGLALYPGFLLSLSRDLAEIVEIAFLLAGLLLLNANHQRWAAVMLTLAALTRETAAISLTALAAVSILQLARRSAFRRLPAIAMFIPLIIILVWQAALLLRWREIPLLVAPWNFAAPFEGIVHLARATAFSNANPQQRWFVEECFLGVVSLSALLALPVSSAHPYQKFAWFGYSMVGVFASSAIWVEDWAFLRVLAEWFVFSWLVLIRLPARSSPVLFGLHVLTMWVWLRLAGDLLASTHWVT